jgi:hypothetical protein
VLPTGIACLVGALPHCKYVWSASPMMIALSFGLPVAVSPHVTRPLDSALGLANETALFARSQIGYSQGPI